MSRNRWIGSVIRNALLGGGLALAFGRCGGGAVGGFGAGAAGVGEQGGSPTGASGAIQTGGGGGGDVGPSDASVGRAGAPGEADASVGRGGAVGEGRGGAGPTGGGAGRGDGAGGPVVPAMDGGGCPGVSDFAAPGPFRTTQEAGGSTCTIFRPDPLGACMHPIILWGNGTGTTVAVYQPVLTHWASHGFVVAAANTSNPGSGREMLDCLDFMLQQNSTPGGAFFGKLDTAHVGASGHSQGGGGTIMTGHDPRVRATAPVEPYTSNALGGFDVASIGQQTGPMFLMSGSADTIATPQPNQQRVFDGINVPVFWATLSGADHIRSGSGNISGFRGPATAWLRLHLMGDQSAESLFFGPTCGLCTDNSWAVQRKGIQ